MILLTYRFNKDKEQTLEEEVSFSDVYYPLDQLKSIEQCKVKVYAKDYDDFIIINFDINVSLVAISSYTNKEGELKLHINEDVSFTSNKGEDYESYEYFKGNSINLDPYIYSLIISSFPSKIVFKGEHLPKGNKECEIISEEEYFASNNINKPSPFDVIDNKKK